MPHAVEDESAPRYTRRTYGIHTRRSSFAPSSSVAWKSTRKRKEKKKMGSCRQDVRGSLRESRWRGETRATDSKSKGGRGITRYSGNGSGSLVVKLVVRSTTDEQSYRNTKFSAIRESERDPSRIRQKTRRIVSFSLPLSFGERRKEKYASRGAGI